MLLSLIIVYSFFAGTDATTYICGSDHQSTLQLWLMYIFDNDDGSEDSVHITMSGNYDDTEYFGIGFGSHDMNNTYAIVFRGHGDPLSTDPDDPTDYTIDEFILGANDSGYQVQTPTYTLEHILIDDTRVYFEISRPVVVSQLQNGYNLTFPTNWQDNINAVFELIWATWDLTISSTSTADTIDIDTYATDWPNIKHTSSDDIWSIRINDDLDSGACFSEIFETGTSEPSSLPTEPPTTYSATTDSSGGGGNGSITTVARDEGVSSNKGGNSSGNGSDFSVVYVILIVVFCLLVVSVLACIVLNYHRARAKQPKQGVSSVHEGSNNSGARGTAHAQAVSVVTSGAGGGPGGVYTSGASGDDVSSWDTERVSSWIENILIKEGLDYDKVIKVFMKDFDTKNITGPMLVRFGNNSELIEQFQTQFKKNNSIAKLSIDDGMNNVNNMNGVASAPMDENIYAANAPAAYEVVQGEGEGGGGMNMNEGNGATGGETFE